jgi:hypothetical protein
LWTLHYSSLKPSPASAARADKKPGGIRSGRVFARCRSGDQRSDTLLLMMRGLMKISSSFLLSTF